MTEYLCLTLTIQSITENLYLNILILCKNIMKSYCVKQRKQTECVPGSETYVITKNDRKMMKCKCAECGITKCKFI